MSVTDLIDAIPAAGGHVHLQHLEHWLQGRAVYGGASALIAYTAARRAFTDLPPLRAAQIAFVAPMGPNVELRRDIVRQGRNVVQVRSEIWHEDACALSAFWLFGAERGTNAFHPAEKYTNLPPAPHHADHAMQGKGPAFIQHNFDIRRAQDHRGPGLPIVRRWARLREREGLDPISELILMGDVLPPGAMRAMQRQGPISSINWSFNVLDIAPKTKDGWWLSENASQHAADGYSSERLRMWNADGVQVLDGMQCVAVFG